MDIPKSFTVYFSTRNGWQGIIDTFSDLTPTLKVSTISSGIELPVEMEVNIIENENHYIESEDFNSEQCQSSEIRKILNKIDISCNFTCIPVQYSALVNISEVSVCEDFGSQICSFNAWRNNFHLKLEQCIESKIHYQGNIQIRDGIGFSFLGDLNMKNFTRKKRTLLGR